MRSVETIPRPRAPRKVSFASLAALAAANARYWPSVAPVVQAELTLCGREAELIADPALRELAVSKHDEERFNAEVVATLATLAPRRTRASVVRAIVALELLFDYLDGRTELPSADPIGEGLRLFAALAAAVEPGEARPAGSATPRTEEADGAYMRALGARTRENLFALPAAAQVIDVVRASVERSIEAQTRLHAAGVLGDEQLSDWASAPARAAGLGWREYLGGSASSVLSAHALIAAAADPATTAADAARIDAAYLAIGGVITMLDSVVDHRADIARGEPGFIRLFEEGELEEAMRALTREALARAREAPHGAHHEMTLAGVVAYYTTHPGARDPHARAIVAMLRRELAPTIWPGLLVLRGWRVAKWTRASRSAGSETNAEHATRSDGVSQSGAIAEAVA